MEVDKWLLRNLSLNISLRLQVFHLLQRGVVRVHVCAVVLVVVELHNLAGDGGLEGAIVIYKRGIISDIILAATQDTYMEDLARLPSASSLLC